MRRDIVKKFIFKYSHIISGFALFMTTMAANRSCMSIMHQPELPKSAKNLRKF